MIPSNVYANLECAGSISHNKFLSDFSLMYFSNTYSITGVFCYENNCQIATQAGKKMIPYLLHTSDPACDMISIRPMKGFIIAATDKETTDAALKDVCVA